MHITLTQNQFVDKFRNSSRREQFSVEALRAIYDYYEDDEIELDIIAICCQWTEYKDFVEAFEDLDIEYSEGTKNECYNKLEDEYCVMYLDNGGILIQN